jgi:hypothetical protein
VRLAASAAGVKGMKKETRRPVKNSGSEVYISYCPHCSAGFSLQVLEEGAHPERSTRNILIASTSSPDNTSQENNIGEGQISYILNKAR